MRDAGNLGAKVLSFNKQKWGKIVFIADITVPP